MEENTIVSSVEFQESGDRSHVMGQFVSANCSKPYNSATRARGRYGNSRESRDATLAMARRNIAQVAGTLRLPGIYVDKAYRLYTLALQRNFIFGRRQMHVVATCLYTICRQEKSPHLLIDFSDALQVNVYVLGKSFLQFTRLLDIHLPVVDPALYIHRFSARLELGDKMSAVSTTALRIVTRFKKDWVSLGRRPDGVCAAAMLIAARAQGFHKSQEEVAKIFRISGDTLSRRLHEFASTPSAQLTVDEFHSLDDANEFDPPGFISNQLQQHGDALELTLESSGVEERKLDDDDESEAGLAGPGGIEMLVGGVRVVVPVPQLKRKVVSSKRSAKVKSAQDLYNNIYGEIDAMMTSRGAAVRSADDEDDEADGYVNPIDSERSKRLRAEADSVNKQTEEAAQAGATLVKVAKRPKPAERAWNVHLSEKTMDSIVQKAVDEDAKFLEELLQVKEKIKALGEGEAHAKELEHLRARQAELELDSSKRYRSVPDSGFQPQEEEIDSYLMSAEEVNKRTKIRDQMYGAFMAERQRKKEEKAAREQDTQQRAQASGKVRGRKSSSSRPAQQFVRSRTYAPAEPKRTSSKINYSKLGEAFPNDPVGAPAAAAPAVAAAQGDPKSSEAEPVDAGDAEDDYIDDYDEEEDYYDDEEYL